MTYKELVALAERARENAYAPYSGFTVGAALLCGDGEVYTGCNIENASFTPTCCAERVAVFKAVSEGKKEFEAIAVVGGQKGSQQQQKCTPCGVCRQVLSEFASEDMKIVFFDKTSVTLGELLPMSYKL